MFGSEVYDMFVDACLLETQASCTTNDEDAGAPFTKRYAAREKLLALKNVLQDALDGAPNETDLMAAVAYVW
jgi:hypothetical protein